MKGFSRTFIGNLLIYTGNRDLYINSRTRICEHLYSRFFWGLTRSQIVYFLWSHYKNSDRKNEVVLKNGKWIGDDPELAAALNDLSDDVESYFDYYTNRDEALALNAIKKLVGKITKSGSFR